MKPTNVHWLVASALLFLSGCANFSSIHRTTDLTGFNPGAISVDAKQRVILTRQFKDGPAACAEPSPDALSALAQSLSGSADLSAEKVEAALKLKAALSQTESAAFIGLRTQTIQLLRDGMYRLCEGFFSGALDQASFNRLQRRYQYLMMGLLSIEQLTQTVVAPQLAIIAGAAAATAGANAETTKLMADAYAEAQRNTADAKTKADIARQNMEKAKADNKDANTIQQLEKDSKAEDEKLKLAQDKEAKWRATIANTSGYSSGVSGGIAQLQNVASRSDSATFKPLADAVTEIVRLVVDGSFRADECYLYVTTHPSKDKHTLETVASFIHKCRADEALAAAQAENKKKDTDLAAAQENLARNASASRILAEQNVKLAHELKMAAEREKAAKASDSAERAAAEAALKKVEAAKAAADAAVMKALEEKSSLEAALKKAQDEKTAADSREKLRAKEADAALKNLRKPDVTAGQSNSSSDSK